MANEHLVRAAQQQTALTVAADRAVATDVQDGVRKAMTTNSPNQFVMTFEGQVDGKKVVSPYVKKAGRSVILNEVAKKKGGLAKLYSVCIRSAQETRDDILKILAALPPALQTNFLQSRNNDTRALTLPDGWALYKFVILFRSGEKWEGEGLASAKNVRAQQLWSRLDEMAETRAFMRCVGRGTADGFINPEQAAGSGDFDAAEAELLAEEQGELDYIDAEEAGPDGIDPFRTSDGGGQGGPVVVEDSQGGPVEGNPAEEGEPAGTGDAPDDAGIRRDSEGVRGGTSGEPGEVQPVPDANGLIALAKSLSVYLLDYTQTHYRKRPSELTEGERAEVFRYLQGVREGGGR